ncbi:hypothetical protein [Sporolactobacillus sp. KGMB 08714]|uniref:hypothetical protein n=1 Tax=Sporolactobacillus sp. KGMB 08714 TaxID=3064704 RepID=UPI002FBE50AC
MTSLGGEILDASKAVTWGIAADFCGENVYGPLIYTDKNLKYIIVADTINPMKDCRYILNLADSACSLCKVPSAFGYGRG